MNIAAVILLSAAGLLPLWEIQLEATPRGEGHIVSGEGSGQILLVPLGSSGLGALGAGGLPLPGFPVSRGAGTVLRPTAVPGSTGETLIAYADNEGGVHLIDLQGNEQYGWPVENSSNVITSITAIDLNDDGLFEIAYGTGDGRVHLLDIRVITYRDIPLTFSPSYSISPRRSVLAGATEMASSAPQTTAE